MVLEASQLSCGPVGTALDTHFVASHPGHQSRKTFQRVSEDDQQKGEDLIDGNRRAKKMTPIRMSSRSLV